MKKLILAAALLASPAFAADLPPAPYLPVKALPVVDCTPTSCSGFYAGFNVDGIGTNLNVLGQGINGSLFAAGFGIGVQGGYQFWNGTYFFAGEVAADYMTDPPSALNASTHYWRTSELVKAGAALCSVFGGCPVTPPPPVPFSGSQGPVLPANLLAQVTAPYLILGTGQRSGSNAFVSGAGVQAALAQGWNLSIEYQNWQYGNAQLTPIVSQANENVVSVKLNRMF